MTVNELKKRLANYPGAHAGEDWKLETDLTKCTPREKEAVSKLGLSGEVSHMLFGWRYTK